MLVKRKPRGRPRGPGGPQKRFGYTPWRSTGPVADDWERVRRETVPRPTAHEFVALCDRFVRELAERFGDRIEKETVIAYVRLKLRNTGDVSDALTQVRRVYRRAG